MQSDALLLTLTAANTPPSRLTWESELNEKTEEVVVEVTWSQFETQMMDIITALRHMLMSEIPRKSVINGENLEALKLWMCAMKKYMPGTIEMRTLLYRLHHWIENISTETTYKQWTEKVEILQEQLGHPLPSTANYMACRGSKNYFRGFPCGLWTIIHAMSIQAYKLEKGNANFSSKNDLINPFHQFIWHFFICAECATHFHEEILSQNMTTIVEPASEDPAFPKQQFPPVSLCSRCWRPDGQFDEEEVLDFMINYYGNLKIDGLESIPYYNDFCQYKFIDSEKKELILKSQIGAFNVNESEGMFEKKI
uniref:Sulfhydryl oxidase n=1 Tax=Setaria digitata TaxID=48799 RepID=A0A915Q4B4_9BILA